MPYKAVIFDFDGTLADSFESFVACMNESAGKFGFPSLQTEDWDRLRGMSALQLMQTLEIPLWKVPIITCDVRKRMTSDLERIRLFPQVPETLSSLHRMNIPIAVVTSNTRANVEHVLGRELKTLVKHYECGASLFGKQKKFMNILQRTGLSAHEVLCIGDEIRDADAARSAGLPFMGVAWGYTRPEVLATHSKSFATSMVDILKVFDHDPIPGVEGATSTRHVLD